MVRTTNLSASTSSSSASVIIAVAATVAILYYGRTILIPIALALVLSFLLTPLVSWLQKIRLGRTPSVLIVLTLCFAAAGTIGWGVAGQLLEITSHARDYKVNLEDKVHALHSHKNAPIVQATATVQELNKELAVAPAAAADAARNSKDGTRNAHPIAVQVTGPPPNLVQNLRDFLGPLAGPIESAFLVIIFMAFMLINREDLRNRLIRLGGTGQLTIMTQALEDASDRLSQYLLLQFVVNGSYGLLFGLGLFWIGVPHALLWGAMAAMLRFVPYVGTWIAVAFPMAMAAAVFPGWSQCLLAFGLFGILELLVANVIEPWLYGSHIGVSPFAILVAAAFWATLWGPVGLILSTPLTLCLILVGRYVPQMSFLEVLLGDDPVLTPQQVYYQRLLAMDSDEARNVAKKYLEDKPLEDLYGSVLIPALRLAEEDRHSDVLGDKTSEFISQSTRELIDDLSESAKSPPEPEHETPRQNDSSASRFTAAKIVCVPARDDADELVGMMLCQLVRRAGNEQCRYLPIGAVEDMLEQVERGEYQIVCVSALPPFAVGQARSLCRRLRARFPKIEIVVGLWGFAGGVPKAQERVGPSCTDAVCTNLPEALLQLRRLSELQPDKNVSTDKHSEETSVATH